MKMRNVQCPVCGALLSVPPGTANCTVKCGMCHFRFRLPRRIAVTEDAVADWLWQAKPPEEAEPEPDQPIAGEPDTHLEDAGPITGKTAVLPALGDRIRLVKVDKSGALFEFSAARLMQVGFRCAMPRRCLRCGGRLRIEPHLIIYSQRLEDSFAREGHYTTRPALSSREAASLTGRDLLDALGELRDVPPPGNLPMPYWLCDMCSGSGMIAGQIQINAATGRGTCRLLMHNLHLADEFFLGAGGEGTPDYAEFHRYVVSLEENPWDSLPEAVQNRLGVWYRPGSGEKLIAYIPDRDLAQSQDGMSGVVVSNQRFIYHTQMRHKEAKVGEALRLNLPSDTGRIRMRIKSPNWEVKRFIVDRQGADLLRRALSASKFKAVWY